jgi:methyl-accepting chemotaxis protein
MLGKLSISQKLWGATALLAIPALWLVGASIKDGFDTKAATETELAGLQLARTIRPAVEKVGDYAALAAKAGSSQFPEQHDQMLKSLRADVKYFLTEGLQQEIQQAKIDGGLAAQLNMQPILKQLNDQWSASGSTLTKDSAALKVHWTFQGKLLDFQRSVAERTGLSTDPAVDTSALLSAVLEEIPDASADLNEIRALSLILAGRKTAVNQQEAAQIATLTRSLVDNVQKIRRRMETASRANPALGATLTPVSAAFTKTATGYIEWINRRILSPQGIDLTVDQIALEGERASANFFKTYQESISATRSALAARAKQVADEQVTRLAAVAIGLLLVFGTIVFINYGITKQVVDIQQTFERLRSGELTARAQERSQDELGQLAANLNLMLDQVTTLVQTQEEKDMIQRSIQRLLNEVSVVAEGDLTREAAVTADITGAIADAFNYMTAELRDIISATKRITNEVNHSAQAVQSTTSALAESSVSQATQISQASERMEEIAKTIQSVASNSTSAADVASLALQNAREGAESVRATMQGMTQIRNQVQSTSKRIKRLGESSQEIGEITALIGDVADRTSILALNASIQAAMAGDTGKGFALVAEEVERLAERATEATKRIEALVSSIQNETNEAIVAMETTTREVVSGSDLANNASQTLARIESVSVELARLISSISAATKVQSQGTETVAKTISKLSQSTQSNASNAKSTAEVVRSLAEQANSLQASIERFRLPGQSEPVSLTGQWAAFVGNQQ